MKRALLAGLLLIVMRGGRSEAAEATPPKGQPAVEATEKSDKAKPATRTEVKKVKGIAFADRLHQGGLIVYILILISVALAAVTLERLFRLQRRRFLPPGLADRSRELWKSREFRELRAACDARPSSLSDIITSLATHRSCSAIEASHLAGDIASLDMRVEMQRVIPFALIATISPLLGLLGTVSGMIDAFEMVAIAGSLGDASLLADGISKALVTTAAGLIVAVPAIALFNFFKVRTNRVALALDSEVNGLITEWFLPDAGDDGDAAKEAA